MKPLFKPTLTLKFPFSHNKNTVTVIRFQVKKA